MRDFHLPGRSPVLVTNGLSATSHPLAAATAIELLKSGGNAMDAAIGAAVLLGLCEPQMTGLGGDCFVLFTPPGDETVRALNGSGRAPEGLLGATLRDAGHTTMPLSGAIPVTIPGAVDAFCRLSEDWGRLGLGDILGPAIHYAEHGIPVAPRVAWDWSSSEDALVGPGKTHFLVNGKAPRVGQLFRAPGQAEVLRRLAKEGRDAFYTGEIAEDMIATLNAHGGTHTAEDFAATACTYCEPIKGSYKGIDLIEHPPNGQGATAILMANMLRRFDLDRMDPLGAERVHLEAEVTKLAYDARNRIIADPDHTTRLDHLLSDDLAESLAALIDPNRALPNPATLTEALHRDTVYITVVDRDRMKVSLIYSIFHSFGSGLASERFGILFQNRGGGFNLTDGHPNEAGPGKRPMHTIIPGMLAENGRVTMPFGVMGGGYQPTGHARVLTNCVDYGMDPQTALDAPRAFFEDGELRVERGYSDAVRAELAEKGHTVVIPDEAIGGAQAIRIDHESGVLEGASDPRKDGCAIGY